MHFAGSKALPANCTDRSARISRGPQDDKALFFPLAEG